MPRKKLDLLGKVFNRLTILEEAGRDRFNKVLWSCRCSCGELTVAASSDIVRGSKASCGCIKRERAGQLGKNQAKQKIKIICKECYNSFEVRPSRQFAIFCCNSCYHKWKSKHPEFHNNWKGGITSENSRIRNSKRYAIWRSLVFERDNYTCQKCGDSKGGNLQAHHLRSFSRFPQLRFEISNGFTFCKLCHDKFHSLYGTKAFTSDDCLEYVSEGI